ncbi:MAG: prepilin peptidase, partial [Trebonia sp.]
RWLWCSVLPVTGRCPHCKARIGPYAMAAELVTALVLAVIAARAPSGWELAALAWLALLAVPLAFIDIAVQRLPDPLTISAFAGTLVLLAAAEGAAHQPWPLVRAVIGAAALAGFYLALWLVFPDQLGLGDVKIAASIGLVLAWGSWSELFVGALAGALLGAVYAQVLSARREQGGRVYLPLGPFLLLGAFAAIALLPPPMQVPVSARYAFCMQGLSRPCHRKHDQARSLACSQLKVAVPSTPPGSPVR